MLYDRTRSDHQVHEPNEMFLNRGTELPGPGFILIDSPQSLCRFSKF